MTLEHYNIRKFWKKKQLFFKNNLVVKKIGVSLYCPIKEGRG
jgi:hypothetical protein